MMQNTPSNLAILDEAYQQTLYEVFTEAGTIQLHVNRRNLEIDQLLQQSQAVTWALITAYNPYSQLLDSHENHRRNQTLLDVLKPMGKPIRHAVGWDKSDQWPPEESLFIIGITRADAIAIGQQFSQNAILYGELGQAIELLWLVDNHLK